MKKELEALLKELKVEPDSAQEILNYVMQFDVMANATSADTVPVHLTIAPLEDITLPYRNAAPPSDNTDPIHRENLGRYHDLGLLGQGGMGEVRKVLDLELNRYVAMKILRHDRTKKPRYHLRFNSEGQIAAQLEHPNIIPVYELGILPDKRPYFTMQIIKDRSFRDVIIDVHRASANGQWRTTDSGWSLNRMLNAFLKICDAISYAHNRGVIHRDLKPSNVMLGEHGEVIVVDWGIAKVYGQPDFLMDFSEPVVSNFNSGGHATRHGMVSGTPSYMSPEQASGVQEDIGFASDIFSLGIILYEILDGQPPFRGKTPGLIIEKLIYQEPPPLFANEEEIGGCYRHPSGRMIPIEIAKTCLKAISKKPVDRFSSVEELSTAIRNWLQGAKQRESALEIVQVAKKSGQQALMLENRADSFRDAGERLLEEIPDWESEDKKSIAWSKLDEARILEDEADICRIEKEQSLQGALTHKPDLLEAHLALAELYCQQHRKAEEERDDKLAAAIEVKLIHHVKAIPKDSRQRQAFEKYINGNGLLTLHTHPPGARVFLEKFNVRNRRLVAEPYGELGETPLKQVPIKMGSYRLRIQKEGFHETLYPVFISREGEWNAETPQGVDKSLVLQAKQTLSENEVFVPQGWFWCGGDPTLANSLTRQQLWVDSFVITKHPITNAQYIDYLNNLLQSNQREEALRRVPRERGGTYGEQGSAVYGLNEESGFYLRPDADGDVWDLQWPVMMVDWQSACAYAKWRSEKDGLSWRLPYELEWEKAARGADARIYPWGNHFDPSWCIMRSSHRGRPMPQTIHSNPMDRSPYGVIGMGGNVRNWTLNAAHSDYANCNVMPKPAIDPFSFDMSDPSTAGPQRIDRGGCWNGSYRYSRVAGRDFAFPWRKDDFLGFRIVRDV